MAMIDYGCVVIKNGVVQNCNEFFMNMKRSVGWTDKDSKDNIILDHNYMGYIGDEDLTIAFYKCYERVHIKQLDQEELSMGEKIELSNNKVQNFALERKYIGEYSHKENWVSKKFIIDILNYGQVEVHVKYLSNSVKMLYMTYKGDHYRVIYGYGIDSNWNTWNEIKHIYLGKKLSNRIDKIYKQYIKDFGYKALLDTDLKYVIGYSGPDRNDYDEIFDSIKFIYGIDKKEIGDIDPDLEFKVTPSNIDDLADWFNKRYEEKDRFITMTLHELSEFISPKKEDQYKFILTDNDGKKIEGYLVAYIL